MVEIGILTLMDALEERLKDPGERWKALRDLMEAQVKANSAAAKSLGSIKSEKKAAASRENGKRGGRPREGK